MKTKITRITKKDLKEFYKIYKDYTDGELSFSSFKKKYEKFSDLFLGAYLKDKLIGIIFGLPSKDNEKEIVLHSIAVLEQYWRRGAGSTLLKKFLQECKKQGFTRISVGAGEGVEKFYLKNGFKVCCLLVKVNYKFEKILEEKFKNKISKKVKRKNYVAFYIKVNILNERLRNKIKRELKASEVIFILERKI